MLERVERSSAYADLALHAELGRERLSRADRALATELVYGTLRWRGRLDFLLTHMLDRDLAKLEPVVRCALRLGAYQLSFTDRVPDSAAVDEAVRCVRAAGLERATGLVNAVLRRLAAEGRSLALPELARDPLGHLTHALSLPGWIANRWIELGPEEAAALATACNVPPPITLRANLRRTTREALLDELRERHPEAELCAHATRGIRLGRRGDPSRDPAFLAGRFTVQDEASQLVVELLDPQPGERVLDACAAPGAKASAIAERVGDTGGVIALDRHPRRLALVARDARRLGLSHVETAVADATRGLGPHVEARFDRVLVDAPCSGLGTLRRNPDLRWRVQPADPARLAETQLAILRSAAAVLRPGGALVYSTCTLTHEENESVVEAFLAQESAFQRAPRSTLPEAVQPLLDDEGRMRTWPHRHDADGFFAARLERSR